MSERPDCQDDPDPGRPVLDTQQDWVDLAGRTAGEAPRQQAEVLRSAAPVRTLVARAFRVKTEERSWRIGAKGEAKVGRLLADLTGGDPRWRVIHSVPVGTAGSDIDHVAIGPGGIFTLNTKNHPDAKVWVAGDTFMVNGQRHPYVRNSRHEARRAAKLLGAVAGVPVSVTGVIVVMGAKSVTVRELPPDVRIVERRQLLPWLRAQPEWLPLAGIDHLYGIARRSTTWVL